MLKQLEASPSVRAIVDEIAEGIAAEKISPFDAMLQFCKLCEAIRSGDVMSDWHKSLLAVPEACTVCPPTAKKR